MDIIYYILIGIGIYVWWYTWKKESERKKKIESERKKKILSHLNEWGEDICNTLIAKKIRPEMTEEMVLLSWGRPGKIENKEITAKYTKTRWIYGTPRKDASYVWFKNGEIWKIKQ